MKEFKKWKSFVDHMHLFVHKFGGKKHEEEEDEEEEMGGAHDCENLGFCLTSAWNLLAEREAGRQAGR